MVAEPSTLFNSYFDEALSSAEVAAPEWWLNADPANMQAFAEWGTMHNRIHELVNRTGSSSRRR